MKAFILSLLLIGFTSCLDNTTQDAPMDNLKDTKPLLEEVTQDQSECICTKEFRPVCSKEGKVYPNACQAECDGVTDYTLGDCNHI